MNVKLKEYYRDFTSLKSCILAFLRAIIGREIIPQVIKKGLSGY